MHNYIENNVNGEGYMINIAVCDDNVEIVEQIRKKIMEYKYNSNIVIFHSGIDLIQSLMADHNYDLIFLDIEMPEINGINTGKKLREMEIQSLLIYVSSHKDYYYEAFETEPFRFINKPIDWDVFKSVFEIAINRLTKLNHYFYYQKDKGIKQVLLNQILYFESSGRTIKIVTQKENYSYYGKLDEVENLLAEKNIIFFRIHKSYIINSSYICQLEFAKVHLVNGDILPISENRRTITRRAYMNYIGGIMCEHR